MPTWNELSWPRIKQRAEAGDVVVVPVGVIEQHGHHLPVDTDAFIPQEIIRAAALRSDHLLQGPTVHFGYTPSNRNFPGSIHLSTGTWIALIREIVQSIARAGFTRIVLLNGHGGQVILSRLTSAILLDEDGISVVALNWFGLVEDEMARLFGDEQLKGSKVGHAGAVETSMNLHLRPELSDQGERVTYLGGSSPDYIRKVGGFRQTPREDVSPSGVMGDPTLGDAAKGSELFEAAVTRLVEFVEAHRQNT